MPQKSLLCLKKVCYKQKKRVMSNSTSVMSKNSLLYTTPRLLYEKNPCYPNFAKKSSKITPKNSADHLSSPCLPVL